MPTLAIQGLTLLHLPVTQKRREKDEEVEISGLTEDAAGTSGGGEEAVSRGRSSGEEPLGALELLAPADMRRL